MDLKALTDQYYSARIAYEKLKDQCSKLYKVLMARETELIDAMLDKETRSIKREDGTSPTLVKSTTCSIAKDNHQLIRQWLLETEGDDNDYVHEVVDKWAVVELVKKKMEDGESEFPAFLNVDIRPKLRVNGWQQYKGQRE